MAVQTVRRIEKAADEIRQTILKRRKPIMRFPMRSLSNVKYDPKTGHFQMRGRKKERTLTVSTVKTFAQTLRMMALSKDLIEQDDIATKREAYYVSKNWDDARFQEQPESDAVMDDVEAFFEVNREQLGFIPEEKGGEISGRLQISLLRIALQQIPLLQTFLLMKCLICHQFRVPYLNSFQVMVIFLSIR